MTMPASAPPDDPITSPQPADQDGTLQIRNVSKAFPNVHALTDVSLDIRPGEILAFMGENGAGKSTLLKIVNGDYQPELRIYDDQWSAACVFKPAGSA